MKRKVLFILLVILSGGVMLSACKKDKSIEPKVSSVLKNQEIPWDDYEWAAMHSAGTNPELLKADSSLWDLDAVSYILNLCDNDPELIPQTGYFKDTMVFRWTPMEVFNFTYQNLWYHLYTPGEDLPDIYNEYHNTAFWGQYHPIIKNLVLNQFEQILQNMGIADTENYRVKTIGFGNDLYVMPDVPYWYPDVPAGDYHCLHWFTYGEWVDGEE